MDRLRLRLVPGRNDYGGHWTGVHLLVNGEDLRELVTNFEVSRGYEPAGGYDAISVDGLAPAVDRLKGAPNRWPGGGRTVLLICGGCREEGCWPLYARIEMTNEVVEWRDFEQPHRPERDYSELHFAFSRSQYDQEVEGALAA